MKDKLGREGDYKAEATFYCSENNYEYPKARDAFNDDLAFEEEQKKLQKKSKKSSGYKKVKTA